MSKKIIWASILGTTLEFYDFALFGVFTPLFAELFFSKGDEFIALIYTLGIFAFGFVARPLGGLFFGYLGDRFGRRESLGFSILLMAFSTIMIGLLPSYHSIGILAPIILIIARLLQGFSTGGETSGAAIFLIEHMKNKKSYGFCGAIVLSGTCIGTILAFLLSSFSQLSIFPDWSWRLLFIFGGLMGCIGFYIRRELDETPEFLGNSYKEAKSSILIYNVFYRNKKNCMIAFLLAGFGGILAYSLAIYFNLYLVKVVGLNMAYSTIFSAVSLIILMLSQIFFGRISDKIGYVRLMNIGAIVIGLVSFPVYALFLTKNLFYILLAKIIFAISVGIFMGPLYGLFSGLFPAKIRYTSVAFFYSLGISIFGGTAPLIFTFFISLFGLKIAPAIYLCASAIGASLVLSMIEEPQIHLEENKDYACI